MSEVIIAQTNITKGKTRAELAVVMQANRTHTCQHCGKEYVNKRRHKSEGNKYCSRECCFAAKTLVKTRLPMSVIYFNTCDVCAKQWVARRVNARICSDKCKKVLACAESLKRNKEKNGDKHIRNCKRCGSVFKPEYGSKNRIYCSSSCLRKHSRLIGKARRRAVEQGVNAENIDPFIVFERDGWKCQICGKRTPKDRRGMIVHNAPELDHRIPMSKGGEHTYNNVQCACRKCNQEKGCSSEVGQYPLFNQIDTSPHKMSTANCF